MLFMFFLDKFMLFMVYLDKFRCWWSSWTRLCCVVYDLPGPGYVVLFMIFLDQVMLCCLLTSWVSLCCLWFTWTSLCCLRFSWISLVVYDLPGPGYLVLFITILGLYLLLMHFSGQDYVVYGFPGHTETTLWAYNHIKWYTNLWLFNLVKSIWNNCLINISF